TAMHGPYTVHRNIKPSNVLITKDSRVVLCDIGLGASILPGDPSNIRSVAYLAPELSSDRTVDGKADFYSLGVLLFEAFTGRTPFATLDGSREIQFAKATSDAPPPSALTKEVPADLDHLTSALLRRDPTDRAGAAEVQRVLEPNRKPRRSAIIEALTSVQDHMPAPRLPLVGRQAEMSLLAGALSGAKRTGATLQLVLGPSGIGKTALTEAFARQLATDSIVLTARCHERETLPFKAFDAIVDALSRRLKQLPAQTRARVLPERADLLAELFPVLRRVEGIGGGARKWRGADPGELRLRAFAALRELLAALARHAPMVIIIDDVHQADLDSLDLLAHLVRPPAAPRCLFIASGRRGPVIDHILQLQARGSFCDVKTLDLDPLPLEEAELLADIAASHFDLNLDNPRAIAIASTGHPGFAIELVRARSEALDAADAADAARTKHNEFSEDESDGADIAELDPRHVSEGSIAKRLPDTDINSLLASRVNRLTPHQRSILEVIAILGTPVSIELIATADGRSFAHCIPDVEYLMDHDLIVASGLTVDAIVEVYHDRIREVVLNQIELPRSGQLHHQIAQALESREDADPERLMHHWRAAGQTRRAVDYAFAAARRAADALEFHRAVDLYQTALAEQLPADVMRATRIELAEVLLFVGQSSAAADEFLAASRDATREQMIDLRRRAALALFNATDIERSAELMAEVTAALNLPAEKKVGLFGGLFGRKPARFTAREAFFERRAPETLAAIDVVTLDALSTASIEMGVAHPQRAFDAHTRFLELSCNMGDSIRYARALCAEAVWKSSVDPGAATRVEHLLATAEAAAAIDGGALERAQIQLTRAITAFHLGNLAAAQSAIAESLVSLESECRGAIWETRTARMYAGWIAWHTGDLGAFVTQSRNWYDTASSNGDHFSASTLSIGLGNLAWALQRDTTLAHELIETAVQMWTNRPVPMHHLMVAVAQVNLELLRGNTHAAADRLARYEAIHSKPDLDRLHLVRTTLSSMRMRVALARADIADREKDNKALQTALTTVRNERKQPRIASPTNDALFTQMNAAVLSFTDSRAAIAEFRSAATLYGQLGQTMVANACRWRAAQLIGGAVGIAETMAAVDEVKRHPVANPEKLLAFLAPAVTG
nr:AAA family ATPase [Kofleriaceae bacterium]